MAERKEALPFPFQDVTALLLADGWHFAVEGTFRLNTSYFWDAGWATYTEKASGATVWAPWPVPVSLGTPAAGTVSLEA